MEEEKYNQIHKENGPRNGIRKEIPNNLTWHVNITNIDLSAKNIEFLDDKIQLPANLLELNLSHNKLTEVPAVISNLRKLKKLNLSHNAIEYFDETPNFYNDIELLDISANNLHGPPYWVWTEKPKNLTRVNLSCNTNITKSFVNSYIEELLTYETLVLEVDLYNCGFKTKDAELLATFSKAKAILFGTSNYEYHGANILGEVPNKGLQKCTGLEKLNLSNTHIHTVNSSIDMLKNLCELHLACNSLNSLPNEFCSLANLQICVLTGNSIIYLPDDMHKLIKLEKLYMDSNKLCMLPEKLSELPNLKVLDLYDNDLYEILEGFTHLQEFDVALNDMDEPEDVDYLEKKGKLRLVCQNRCDGRKPEEPESEHSPNESDDEEYYETALNGQTSAIEYTNPRNDESQRSSSPEDWDSDAHWIPHYVKPLPSASQGWIQFIKQKMQEGNFCPVDAHVVSVGEQVTYEKKLKPQSDDELEGQFDDFSSDDS